MGEIEEKKRAEELNKDLQSIYADHDGNLPDFSRLDGKPGNRLVSILFGAIATIAVLGVATWGGLLFFSKTSGFTGENVELTIETSEKFVAGSEAEVTIRYRNGERMPLARSLIEFRAPAGFEVINSEPISVELGTWSIGSVAPGTSGEVKVRGYVRKELGAALTFEANLDYRPADFNADFQKVSSHTVVVSESALKISGAGPEQMTPGDEIEFVYEYENVSDKPLTDIRFVIDPVEGFIQSSSDPMPDDGFVTRWTIPSIEPEAKGKIAIIGTFSAVSRGSKTLTARIGFADEASILAIASAEAKTNVLKSNLDLALIVNGSDKSTAVSFGDKIFFTIRYENAGDVTLKDVEIVANLPTEPSSGVLDWVSLTNHGVRNGSEIIWTKKGIPGLAALAPGDKGELNFSIQVARKPLAQFIQPNYVIHASVSAKIAKSGNVSGKRVVDAIPMEIKLLSDTSFSAYGRYYSTDGVPLGSGPLPPKVGEKTVYRVYWNVRNSLHELTNLSVTTLLPSGVKWTGISREVTAGSLDFDETGRKVTWRLNRLPTSVPEIMASFDVELSPEAEDIGELLSLTGDNRFEALDKYVGVVILRSQPAVGTDLIGDEDASGKGVVID